MEETEKAEGKIFGSDLVSFAELSFLCMCITMEILKEMKCFITFRISASHRVHIHERDVVRRYL